MDSAFVIPPDAPLVTDPGPSFVDLLRAVAPHRLPGAGLADTPGAAEPIHGTTVLAIRWAAGVVMAGDRRVICRFLDRQPAHREGVPGRRPLGSVVDVRGAIDPFVCTGQGRAQLGDVYGYAGKGARVQGCRALFELGCQSIPAVEGSLKGGCNVSSTDHCGVVAAHNVQVPVAGAVVESSELHRSSGRAPYLAGLRASVPPIVVARAMPNHPFNAPQGRLTDFTRTS